MQVFVHSDEGLTPKLVDVSAEWTVTEVVSNFGSDGEGLWMEDIDEELAPDSVLHQVGVKEHSHLHRHRCREVEVTVRHIDRELPREFRPATTVSRVLRWALGPEGFDIPQREHPEFEFLGCADGLAVPNDVHVGSITEGDHPCHACLSLVKKHNPQG